jgi:hypothetical protein
VLGMDRRFDGWALGARGQTIAPRVKQQAATTGPGVA